MSFSSLAIEIGVTPQDAKAHYTIEVIKQIQWPNEDELTEFTIGILGKDKELKRAFERKASSIIRGKSLKIETIQSTQVQANYYAVILITERNLSLNSSIFSQAPSSLIFTEGRVDRDEQLVSLLNKFSDIQVTLNRDNLIKRNFEVSANLLEFAGTKEDLSQQIKDDEKRLNSLLSKVVEKEARLAQLEANMKEKAALLEQAQAKLKSNNEVLASNKLQLDMLMTDIDRAKQLVDKNRQDLNKQQLHLQEKQDELLAKEQAISDLQLGINANQEILDEQVAKIQKQEAMMAKKDQTINTQKSWLIINLVIIFLFFALIYGLVRLNTLRKKANSDLELLNSQLYEQATTDGMTGLFNRRHFLETTQIELLHQQRNQLQSLT